ncbi:hypothetical protein Hanom_Chr04g00381631 [Helianthus anomalus]
MKSNVCFSLVNAEVKDVRDKVRPAGQGHMVFFNRPRKGGSGNGGRVCIQQCCYKHATSPCKTCCRSPEEAKAFAEEEAHP